jgi:hypothetical protein
MLGNDDLVDIKVDGNLSGPSSIWWLESGLMNYN